MNATEFIFKMKEMERNHRAALKASNNDKEVIQKYLPR